MKSTSKRAAPQPPPKYPPGSREIVLKAACEFLQEVEQPKRYIANPHWPTKNSGITIGFGYDLKHHDETDFRTAWGGLGKEALDRLAEAVAEDGSADLLSGLKDITIPKDAALKALETETKTHYALACQAFPGLNALPKEAQVAVVSIVYNRGSRTKADKGTDKWHQIGIDSRREMRFLKDDIAKRDLIAMWYDIRSMSRVWAEKTVAAEMNRRREKEAALIWPLIATDYKEWRENLGESIYPTY